MGDGSQFSDSIGNKASGSKNLLSQKSTFSPQPHLPLSMLTAISIDQLTEESEVLGEGSFSKVYAAVLHVDGANHNVAVKVLKAKRTEQDPETLRLELEREVRYLRMCQGHAHCVQIIGSFSDDTGRYRIVLERVEHRSLDYVLLKSDNEKLRHHMYKFNVKFAFLQGVALALSALHAKLLIHRDVKPSNVFVDANCTAKLGDFGTVVESGADEAKSQKGTLRFLAPEIIQGRAGATSSSDVYSLALLMWYLFMADSSVTDLPYFEYSSDDDLRKAINADQNNTLRPCFNPTKTAPYPDFERLVKSCWHAEPSQRPQAGEVVERLHRIICKCSKSSASTVSVMEEWDSLNCRWSRQIMERLKEHWNTDAQMNKYVADFDAGMDDSLNQEVRTELERHISSSGRKQPCYGGLTNQQVLNWTKSWYLMAVHVLYDVDNYHTFLHMCKQLGNRADTQLGWKEPTNPFYRRWDEREWKGQNEKMLKWRKATFEFFENYHTLTIPLDVLVAKPNLKHVRIITVFHGCRSCSTLHLGDYIGDPSSS